MEEKKCVCCGELKSVEEYYVHPMMSCGRLNKCKSCCKEQATKRRNEKIEEVREYDRGRANLPHRVEARKKYAKMIKETGKRKDYDREHLKKYRKENPEKNRARCLINYHVRSGNIERLPCEVCGDVKSQAHHKDYSKPFDVVWLCDKHHKELHVRNGTFRKH